MNVQLLAIDMMDIIRFHSDKNKIVLIKIHIVPYLSIVLFPPEEIRGSSRSELSRLRQMIRHFLRLFILLQ